jgi:CheY-like chemotaxis protein
MHDQTLVVRDYILIVDDDEDIRLALSQLFSREGFVVKSATNGAEAIELFESGDRPRLTLVDLRMPGIVGTSVLDYLHHEPSLDALPVAIMTASPELAPDGYRVFRKPLDLDALLSFAATSDHGAEARP